MHETLNEWQEDEQRPEENAEWKHPHCSDRLIQVSKKTLAQNILKNQKFIMKYKNLDAQLQNTLFEY